MAWESLTEQFSDEEMARLEVTPIDELIEPIKNSDPIVILRIFAEFILHEQPEKVHTLLENQTIQNRWTLSLDSLENEYDLMYYFTVENGLF